MIMNTSSTATSSPRWYKLPCHHVCLFFNLSITFYNVASISCSKLAEISYTDHCASFVPESNPNSTPLYYSNFPLPAVQNGFYTDDNYQVLHQNLTNSLKPLSFSTDNLHRTGVEDIFMVEGYMLLYTQDHASGQVEEVFHWRSRYGGMSFSLKGFWSTITGKLCMVGNVTESLREGNMPDIDVVLKLNGVKHFVNITNLINGTLERLNPTNDYSNHSEKLSLFMIPQNHLDYQYTLVSENNIDHVCPSGNINPKRYSSSLELKQSICSILSDESFNSFGLHYPSDCKSLKRCNPFGDEKIGYFPRVMNLRIIHCSKEKQSLRFFLDFPNNSTIVDYFPPFNYQTTLFGEASWDRKNNWLCMVGCRLLNPTGHWANTQVGDCSFRLSLGFPGVWTIRSTGSIVGKLWSIKNGTSSGYSSEILFRSSGYSVQVAGQKYKYTQIGKVKKSSCAPEKKHVRNKHQYWQYPNGHSREMGFNMFVKLPKRKRAASGYSSPFSVGEDFSHWYNPSKPWMGSNTTHNSSQLKMSYKMEFWLPRGVKLDACWDSNRRVEISAEGIYRGETGRLCMVGCRNLGQIISKMDCNILIKIQYPPLNSENNVDDHIQGSIRSTRHKSDPLHFGRLSFSAVAY